MAVPDEVLVNAEGPPRRKLHRSLKVLGTILITLSAITPASSVFIIIPGVVDIAGTGALWSFVAATVVGIFMAFVYAELSSAYPLAGGEYSIVGRTLGKLPGFMVLGLMLVTNILIIAVIALGVGTYLSVVIDGLHAPTVAAVTCLGAILFGVLNIKLNAWVTGIFLALEMLALVILAGLGFLNVERSLGDMLASPVVAGDGGALVPASIGLVGAAVAVAIFAYNGYGSAVYFGEETRDARRSIAKAILWALGITASAEMIPLIAVLMGAPSLEELFGAQSMMQYFVTEVGGGGLNTVLSLGVVIAIVNAVIAILLISARMMFSTGRDMAWPAAISRGLGSIHPRYGSPWVATIVVGVAAAAISFVDLTTLLVVTGTSLVVVYAALALAVMAGRRNGSTRHGTYRMPLFPLPPLVALAALVFVVYENAKDTEIGRPSLLVAFSVLVISGLYYLTVLRRRGTWELQGELEE